MREVTTLQNGCSTRVAILVDGKEKIYRLGVFEVRPEWDPKKMHLEFAFVSDEGNFIDGFYSGGITGSGVGGWPGEAMETPIPSTHKLLTTDMDEIFRLGKLEDERRDKEHIEWRESQYAKVERINALPNKRVFIQAYHGLDIYAEKGESSFNPKYSRNISTPLTIKYFNGEQISDLWLDRFISKDKKFLVSKFREELRWTVEKIDQFTNEDIKKMLSTVKAGYDKFKQELANA